MKLTTSAFTTSSIASCRPNISPRQQLGELTGWAFQSFYGKPGRVDRILNGYSSPYVKMKFLSLKANAAKYEKGAAEDAVAI